jgi:tetratricopeptide (TPR) repeat protein
LASTWILLACLMANLHERSVGFGQGVSWWTYALTSCRSVVLYLKLAIWPHPLVFDYGTHVVQHVAEVVPHALILAALLAGVGILLRYRPALGFAGAWFFLILAPSSSVVPITQQPMAEHRMYLPLAAIIALAVLGLNSWIKRGRLILFAALAVELGCLSVRRNEDYRSALAIWTDTSAKLPGNARAHANLGSVLVDIPGRLSEAISHYDEALRINPDYALAHCDLGVALTKIPGRQTDAIAQFETALRINPGFADAHCDLGAALANIPGRQSEAILHYEAALRIQPDNAKIHDNLGMALSTFPDRMPEAISEYEAALRIEPGLAEVHYHLGTALAQTGNLNGGIAQLEEAVRIRPDYAAADNDLGAALIQAQQYPEAIDRLEHALDLEPNYLGAHNNLGIALLRVGRLPDAADQFNAALKLDPDFSMARINLARAFALMNRLPEARHEVETVLQTNANDESAAAARKVLAQLQLIDNRPASTH